MIREDNVRIPLRDGTILLADIRRPEATGGFPALVAASPYPRQMQDLNAPAGVIEAGPAEFWIPRGYVQVLVNLRGTNGSEGEWTAFDQQERDDLYDIVEWVAAQPWCDGNVGMTGISYFAMTQLAAAVTNPPHLKALFPFDASIEFYDASTHNGLFSAGFITPWLGALGVLTTRKDWLFRRGPSWLLRKILGIPAIHKRFEHVGGENVIGVMRGVSRISHPAEPWNDLWLNMAVTHPTRDEWWADRDLRPLLERIDIPVYLGAEFSNVPLHLGGTLEAWRAHAAQAERADEPAGRARSALAMGVDALRGARLVRPLAEGIRHRHPRRTAGAVLAARCGGMAHHRSMAAAGNVHRAGAQCGRHTRVPRGGRVARLPRAGRRTDPQHGRCPACAAHGTAMDRPNR